MRILSPGVLILVLAGTALSGCHLLGGAFGARPSTVGGAKRAADWRGVATDNDRERLRKARGAWEMALRQARAAGHGDELAALGPLADPDAGLADAAPPPGRYRCRTIKLGAKSAGLLDYVAYPPFDCVISAGPGQAMRFEKVGGSQRQKGMLWPDTPNRMVFLGTVELGDEPVPIEYGADVERDVAGVLERVAPARWRLALPWPRWESNLDLIELTPAG